MHRLLNALAGRAAATPDRTALILPDRAVTYGMLHSGIQSAALKLASLGVDLETQPIGLFVDSPTRHLMISLALARLGATSVAFTRDALGQARSLGVGLIVSDQAVNGVACALVDDGWFRMAGDAGPIREPAPDRILRVEFTSGSTGLPKAIAATGAAIYAQALNRLAIYAISSPSALSLFRVNSNVGFGFALALLMQGRSVGFTDSNDSSIDLLNYHGFGTLGGSPAQVLGLVDRLRRAGRTVPGLDRIILAGAQVAADDLAAIRLCFGADILIDYGASETGPSAFASGALLSVEPDRPTRLAPHQDVEVIRQATGETSVRVRTTGMGWPYAGGVKERPESRGDGWFVPGDLGHFDSDGFLVLAGRADDLVNLAGVKQAPELLEARLRTLSGVRDAGVVATGRPGELGVALVLDEGSSLETVEPRLASLVGRSALILICLAELPKTGTGKLDRPALRELVRVRLSPR